MVSLGKSGPCSSEGLGEKRRGWSRTEAESAIAAPSSPPETHSCIAVRAEGYRTALHDHTRAQRCSSHSEPLLVPQMGGKGETDVPGAIPGQAYRLGNPLLSLIMIPQTCWTVCQRQTNIAHIAPVWTCLSVQTDLPQVPYSSSADRPYPIHGHTHPPSCIHTWLGLLVQDEHLCLSSGVFFL